MAASAVVEAADAELPMAALGFGGLAANDAEVRAAHAEATGVLVVVELAAAQREALMAATAQLEDVRWDADADEFAGRAREAVE